MDNKLKKEIKKLTKGIIVYDLVNITSISNNF